MKAVTPAKLKAEISSEAHSDKAAHSKKANNHASDRRHLPDDGVTQEDKSAQDDRSVPVHFTAPVGSQQTNPDVSAPPIVKDTIASSGQPLDKKTRSFFEPRFGHSFGNVRVHTDAKASASAQAVNARAYTVGRDVVFGSGQYDPSTSGGRHLLAHELSHVVQQGRGGPASPTVLPGSSLEQAADQAANSITRSNGPVAVAGASAPGLARESQSLSKTLTPSMLSDAELEQEVQLVREDLMKRAKRSDPDTVNLTEALNRLEAEAMKRMSAAKAPKNPLIPNVQGASDKERLINAIKILQSVKQVGSGLYEIEIDKQVKNITQKQIDEANKKITDAIKEGLRRTSSEAEYAESGYNNQSELDKKQWIVSNVVKFIGNIKDPGPFLRAQVARSRFLAVAAQNNLKANNLVQAAELMGDSETAAAKAKGMYQMYWENIITAGEATVTVLEYTRDASFIALGVLATIASGGAAAGLLSAEAIGGSVATTGTIATFAPLVAKVGEAGVKVAYGDKVDWGQLAVDAAVTIILSKFGGKLGDGVAARIIGKNPAAQSLGKHVVAGIVHSVISGKAATAFTICVNDIYAKLNKKDITWSTFVDQLADQLFDPKTTFLDVLNGAISGYGHGRGAQNAAKTPPATKTATTATPPPAAKTETPAAPPPVKTETPVAPAVKTPAATDTGTPAAKPAPPPAAKIETPPVAKDTAPTVKTPPPAETATATPAGKKPVDTATPDIAPAGKTPSDPDTAPSAKIPPATDTAVPAGKTPGTADTVTPAGKTPADTGTPDAKTAPDTKVVPDTKAVPDAKPAPDVEGTKGAAAPATAEPEPAAKTMTDEEARVSKLEADAKEFQGQLKEAIDKLGDAEVNKRAAKDNAKLAKEASVEADKKAKEAEVLANKAKGTEKEADLAKAAEQTKKDAELAKKEVERTQNELKQTTETLGVAKQAESDARQLEAMAKTEASMPKREAIAARKAELQTKRAELDKSITVKQAEVNRAQKKLTDASKQFPNKKGAERVAAQGELDTLNANLAKATGELTPLKEQRAKLSTQIEVAEGELQHEIATSSELAPDVKKYLREASVPESLRKYVNEIATIDPKSGMPIDPVYGKPVKTLSPDHIYPVNKIMKLPGFNELSREQQVEVLTLKGNIMGIDLAVNEGKGERSWAEYEGHGEKGPISPSVRKDLMAKEQIARKVVEDAIAERLRK